MEALPNLDVGLECRRDRQRKRPGEELLIRLDRGDHHERRSAQAKPPPEQAPASVAKSLRRRRSEGEQRVRLRG